MKCGTVETTDRLNGHRSVFVVVDEDDTVDFVCTTEAGAEAFIDRHGLDRGNWSVAEWQVWDWDEMNAKSDIFPGLTRGLG